VRDEARALEDPGSAQEKETGRVEAFSDGVFAIAITLLVLDLKIPQDAPGGLLATLLRQWPTFLAYLTSFATILVMWVNHHKLFTHIRRTTGAFLFLNGLLLLFVTVVPFPTSLISAHLRSADAKTAAAIYAGTYFAIAIAFNTLWRYASSGRRLIDPASPPEAVEAITHNYSFGPVLYLAAFALAFFSVTASLALCMGLAIFFAVTASLEKSP
jgi:TMEM175 potassium channel family protein